MSLRLEVFCETALPGDEVGVGGEDAALGGWDASKALRLRPCEGEASLWACELPIPREGSSFKLAIFSGGNATWEPLEQNRIWPTLGLCEGTVFRTKFGEAAVRVELSAKQVEEEARRTRNLLDRKGSALQHDIDQKGANAYYHAHNRKFEVPEDAKVITGPGLITGGRPAILEVGGASLDTGASERIVWIKDYTWSDGSGKVKVYVPLEAGVLPNDNADSMVEATFASHSVDLTINARPRLRLKIDKLNAEIKPDTSLAKVEPAKSRVVLQLAKKRDNSWYSLTKK